MAGDRPLGEIAAIRQGRYLPLDTMAEHQSETAPIPVWGANGIIGFTDSPSYGQPVPLVTCRGNGCGLVQWTGGTAYISNNAMAIIPVTSEPSDTRYLYYSLLNTDFLDVTTGSAQPQITVGHLSRKQIFWHQDAHERVAIAHILGTLDDKIELNGRMNEALEAMARALFKSWFVDFDPVRSKTEGRDPGLPKHLANLFPDFFEDSELGEIPRGWRVVSVADSCSSISSGGTPNTRSSEYWGGDIPWLSSGETRSKFIITTEKTITSLGVSNSSTRLAKAGSTVIASAGQGHTRGQASFLTFDSYINQSVVVLAANRAISSDYFLFFDLERRYEEFRRISDSSSSRGSLTTKLLGSLFIALPPLKLILEFDLIVGHLVSRIRAGLHESRTLAALRDTLLPKLISGELRIMDAERIIGGLG